MTFFKTSSFGNDFICIEAEGTEAKKGDRERLTRAICRRHSGIGADGVVFFRIGKKETVFQIHNRDGGEAELSGNGMAGLGAVLFYRGDADRDIVLKTRVGKKKISLLEREGVRFRLRVEIGAADFADHRFFPFLKGKGGEPSYRGMKFFPVSVGNPHAVVVMKKFPLPAKLAALGKELEAAPLFSARANVEFVSVKDPEHCQVFFYERGVGPTLASSTGSAAVFAVLRKKGVVGDRLSILTRGGEILVSGKETISIEIVTRIVCRGEYFL